MYHIENDFESDVMPFLALQKVGVISDQAFLGSFLQV